MIDDHNTREMERGGAGGASGGNGMLVLSVGGRVGEEWALKRVEGRRSEVAFGGGESEMEGKEEREEKIQEREEEEL